MIVKFSKDTNGQSFKPDVAMGEKFCQLLARFLVSGRFGTYPSTVAQNGLPVLPLECGHYGNEEQCVYRRSQRLVQDELLDCVRLVELSLSIDIHNISGKLFF
jgi:hypothetical protein